MNEKTLKKLPPYDRLLSDSFALPVSQKIISEEQQAESVNQLKDIVKYESFFFVTDMLNSRLYALHGLQKWLGYSDRDFTEAKFRSIVHPAHHIALAIQAYAVIQIGLSGGFNKAFMHQSNYTVFLNIKHNDGHYVLVKRNATPFQYDQNGRLLEYMNIFTIIDQYHDKPFELSGLNPRAFDSDGKNLPILEDVREKTKQFFIGTKFFSKNELEIIRTHAYNENTSVKVISQKLKIAESSAETYHKRILIKAFELFHVKFKSVKEVSVFLRKQSLI
jgi:hypothetical protein